MILADKLRTKYTRNELNLLLGVSTAGRILRNEKQFMLDKVFEKINNSELNYTYEEWLSDFGIDYSEHVEKEMIYNLFTKGKSVYKLQKEFGTQTQIFNYLKYGFVYHGTTQNAHLVFELLGINPDITNFCVEKYNSHIELYGTKEALENFKNKYRLPFEVLYEPYKEKWHLAFNGCLAEYLKLKNS